MFDDDVKTTLPSTPPQNLPLAKEPEDMFANLDHGQNNSPTVEDGGLPELPNALASGKLKIKEPTATGSIGSFPSNPPVSKINSDFTSSAAPAAQVYTMKEPILGKILLLIVLLLVLGGLGYGGWWFYSKYFTAPTNNPVDINANIPAATNTAVTNNVSAEVKTTNNDDTETATNTEIIQDANNDKVLFGEPVDSDRDGLDDIREKALGTNPNNPDTDGDGVNDGDEANIWKTNPLNPDTDGDTYSDGTEIKSGYNPMGEGKIFDSIPAITSTNSSSAKK